MYTCICVYVYNTGTLLRRLLDSARPSGISRIEFIHYSKDRVYPLFESDTLRIISPLSRPEHGQSDARS